MFVGICVVEEGVFCNGVPFVRFGRGSRVLLVLEGGPGNYLPSGFMLRLFNQYKVFAKDRVVCLMSRKSNLPENYSTVDMAGDCAAVIEEEFGGGPVDVLGVSYGGLIAQHLAAQYPSLVGRLVVAMSVYRFSDEGNELDMHFAELLSEGKRRAAFQSMTPMVGGGKIKRDMYGFFMGLMGPLVLSKPKYPKDLIVEGKAEINHDSKEQLAKIVAPTLVIGGDRDYFCPVERLRETAKKIPDAKLIVYEGKGHMILDKRFNLDVLSFLDEP